MEPTAKTGNPTDGDGRTAEAKDDEATTTDVQSSKRMRGKAFPWKHHRSFLTVDDFEAWLRKAKQEGQLVNGPKTRTEVGEKRVYRCTFAKKRGWVECKYKVRALFCRDGGGIDVSWNGQEHRHVQDGTVACVATMNKRVTEVTEMGVADGLKPSQIQRKIESEGLPVPTKKQLGNKINYIKRRSSGKHNSKNAEAGGSAKGVHEKPHPKEELGNPFVISPVPQLQEGQGGASIHHGPDFR